MASAAGLAARPVALGSAGGALWQSPPRAPAWMRGHQAGAASAERAPCAASAAAKPGAAAAGADCAALGISLAGQGACPSALHVGLVAGPWRRRRLGPADLAELELDLAPSACGGDCPLPPRLKRLRLAEGAAEGEAGEMAAEALVDPHQGNTAIVNDLNKVDKVEAWRAQLQRRAAEQLMLYKQQQRNREEGVSVTWCASCF